MKIIGFVTGNWQRNYISFSRIVSTIFSKYYMIAMYLKWVLNKQKEYPKYWNRNKRNLNKPAFQQKNYPTLQFQVAYFLAPSLLEWLLANFFPFSLCLSFLRSREINEFIEKDFLNNKEYRPKAGELNKQSCMKSYVKLLPQMNNKTIQRQWTIRSYANTLQRSCNPTSCPRRKQRWARTKI